MDQLIGCELNNRYQITSLLGRQPGRRTYLARDLDDFVSPVVIKLLIFDPDFKWDNFKLFEREIAVLKCLDHPKIPTYLNYFETETQLGKGIALVQSYIDARSLQDLVQSGYVLDRKAVRAIAQSLLEVLDYLHSQNPPVVHRDIKPRNILLGDSPAEKLRSRP